MFPRRSGIVCHLTSLPGPYGIGEIGRHARQFIDTLAEMGQHIWQVLPIGPTTYGDSPYSCLSTFAGNQLVIAFDQLIEDGLLDASALDDFPQFNPLLVDYGPVIEARNHILDQVARNFLNRASSEQKSRFDQFCAEHAGWLEDYALYIAIKNAHGGLAWPQWSPELVSRNPAALEAAHKRHEEDMHHVRVLQFLFHDQWANLVHYAHDHDIQVMGDIPIFVAHDSADVWANPELFYLDDAGNPSRVAGVPPDYFSKTGQRWGNPLYRWGLMRQNDYQWWKNRMRKVLGDVDIVRIDHFRGFEAYWEIQAEEETAVNGRWVKGPDHLLFDAFQREFGDMAIVAEDLGVITEPVERLRDRTGFPGMKVLQFIWGDEPLKAEDRPENFPQNTVAYTGTHDNNTTLGWYQEALAEQNPILNAVHEYLGTDEPDIAWAFIATAWRSASNTALTTLQDLLGLGEAHRFNFPGKSEGNWQWRFTADQLTPVIKARLLGMTEGSGRT